MYAARDVWTRDAYVRTAVNYAAAVAEEVRRQQDAVFTAKAQLEANLLKEQVEFQRRLERRRVRRARTSSTQQRRSQRGAVTGLCQEVEQELFSADLAKQRDEEEARLRAEYPLAYLDDATENALSGYMLLPVLQAKLAQLVQARRNSSASCVAVQSEKAGKDDASLAAPLKRVKHEESRPSGTQENNNDNEVKQQGGSQLSIAAVKDDIIETKLGSSGTEGSGAYVVPRPRIAGMPVACLCARHTATPSPTQGVSSAHATEDVSHVSSDKAGGQAGTATTTTVSEVSCAVHSHLQVPAWLAAAAAVPAALDFVRQAWQLDLQRQEELLRQRRVYLQEELDMASRVADTARVEQVRRALEELQTEQTSELRALSARRAQLLARVAPSTSLCDGEHDADTASGHIAADTEDATQIADSNTSAQAEAVIGTSNAEGSHKPATCAVTELTSDHTTGAELCSSTARTRQPAAGSHYHTIALPREDSAEDDVRSNNIDGSAGVSLAWYKRQVQRYLWPTAMERGIGHSLHGIVRPTRNGWRPAQTLNTASDVMLAEKKKENKLDTTYKGAPGFLPSSALRGFLYLAGRGDFLCATVSIASRQTNK